MATDYAKLKNAELEALLKERNLPHTGKKADMVARLQDHDKAAGGAASAGASAKPAAKPAPAPSAPAAAALAAGGTVRAANPTAVPNQVAGEDPAKTSDLTVDAPAGNGTAASAPAASFSSKLPTTDLDAELEKRKARARKFGIVETDDDSTKALERAKRFGTGTSGEQAGGDAVGSRLDAALPERAPRKRGRDKEAPAAGTGAASAPAVSDAYEDPGLKRRRNNKGVPAPAAAAATESARPAGPQSWMSEQDRTAAERRKARFG